MWGGRTHPTRDVASASPRGPRSPGSAEFVLTYPHPLFSAGTPVRPLPMAIALRTRVRCRRHQQIVIVPLREHRHTLCLRSYCSDRQGEMAGSDRVPAWLPPLPRSPLPVHLSCWVYASVYRVGSRRHTRRTIFDREKRTGRLYPRAYGPSST